MEGVGKARGRLERKKKRARATRVGCWEADDGHRSKAAPALPRRPIPSTRKRIDREREIRARNAARKGQATSRNARIGKGEACNASKGGRIMVERIKHGWEPYANLKGCRCESSLLAQCRGDAPCTKWAIGVAEQILL